MYIARSLSPACVDRLPHRLLGRALPTLPARARPSASSARAVHGTEREFLAQLLVSVTLSSAMRSFMQSEAFHFTVFSALLMSTVGALVFFSEDVFADTATRRHRFQLGVLPCFLVPSSAMRCAAL